MSKLFLARNTLETQQRAIALFHAHGAQTPAQPHAMIAIVSDTGDMVSAVGINVLPDSIRVSWLVTNPEIAIRERHSASVLAFRYAMEYSLITGKDITADKRLPYGVMKVLGRVGGRAKTERVARFSPTASYHIEVPGTKKRRPSARAPVASK